MKKSRRVGIMCGMAFVLIGFFGRGIAEEPVDPFAPVEGGVGLDPFAPAEEVKEVVWFTGMTVQLEYIGLSSEDYYRLSDAYPRDRGKAMREELVKMIAGGKAEVLETVAVKTRSGQRAKVESVLEFIYPTKFALPPGLKEPVPEAARKKLGEVSDAEWEAMLPKVARGFPSGFAMRGVGIVCKVDPILGNDEVTVDLNFAPEIVGFAGQIPQSVIGGRETGVEQPNFFTQRLSTADTHRAGEHVFQTAFSPPGVDGGSDGTRKVMLFTRVLVHRVADDVAELEEWNEALRIRKDPDGVAPPEGAVDPFAPPDAGLAGPVPEEPAGVSLQLEYFHVDHGEVTALLNGYDPAADEDGKALRGAVGKLADTGKAELVEFLVTRTRGGVRAKVEAIEEVIYPKKFDLPIYSDEKALEAKLRERQREKRDGDVGGAGESPEEKAPEDGEVEEGGEFRSVPSAFKARKTGTTVEVDPVVSRDLRTIKLNLASETVRLIRWEHYGPGMEQPQFYSETVSTSVMIRSGGYALVSVGAPPGEDGKTDRKRRTLLFVHPIVHGR